MDKILPSLFAITGMACFVVAILDAVNGKFDSATFFVVLAAWFDIKMQLFSKGE